MYFSKISLSKNPDILQKLNNYQQKAGYYYHQLIWNLFAGNNPDKKRDFLYRAETINHWPYFYAISATEPYDDKGIWEIVCKEYNPKIQINEQLHFRLRVNPRICHSKENNKKEYFDVVQTAWQKNLEKIKAHEINKNEIMQTAGEEWLSKKGILHGFKVNSVIVENFCKENFNKKQHKISFSTLDFVGQLTVLDNNLFLKTLFSGIGSAKGFGCGLLMVKR